MRRLIPLVLALGALVALAAPAAAAKPDRYSLPIGDLVLEDLCAFDIHIEFTINREYGTDFYDRDGNLVRTLYTGSLRIRATNMESQAAMDFNIGGPGVDEYNADGTVTTTFLGHGLPLITDSDLTRGRFSYLFSSDFSEATEIKAAGHDVDLCVLLGG